VFDVLRVLLAFKDWVLEDASRYFVDDALMQCAEEEQSMKEMFGFLASEDSSVNEEVVVREDERWRMELRSSNSMAAST
jgi:hypothetical protein